MKRRVCILVIVVMLCSLLTVSVSAEAYELSNTDMSVHLDDTIWYVFTRDNISNNAELEELGISYDTMYGILYDNEVYMDAIVFYDDGEYIELFIRKKAQSTEIVNLTDCSDDQVMVAAETIAEAKGTGRCSVYKNQYKFVKMEYHDSDLNYEICAYVTVVNQEIYSLTFQSTSPFTDWEYEEMEDIVDSVQFDVDPSLKEKNDEGFSDYVISGAIKGAVIGGGVGAVVAIVNKKKKKKEAEQEQDVPPANTPEQE